LVAQGAPGGGQAPECGEADGARDGDRQQAAGEAPGRLARALAASVAAGSLGTAGAARSEPGSRRRWLPWSPRDGRVIDCAHWTRLPRCGWMGVVPQWAATGLGGNGKGAGRGRM